MWWLHLWIQVREGRNQTLSECLKKEFRLTMNLLRSVIFGDLYEGIRAVNIDKDNAPKWDPPVLDQVTREKLDLVFEPFKEELELQIPAEGEAFWLLVMRRVKLHFRWIKRLPKTCSTMDSCAYIIMDFVIYFSLLIFLILGT